MATTGTHDIWQYNKSVIERNQYMLEHELATDVVFLVGNDQQRRKERIAAHKYMLIAASPVFWSMFEGELKETGDILVPDVSPEAFREMLKFIYCENTNITVDLVMEILYTSKKYLVPALTQTCTSFLENQLNAQNACIIFQQCILFEERPLANKCLQIIRKETPHILRSGGFKKISRETLMLILDDDELNIEETEVVLACIEWAIAQIQNEHAEKNYDGLVLREQLGPALYKLRLTQMNIQQFGDVAVKSGILNKDEENFCFRYLSQTAKPTDILFPTKPRTGSKISCLMPPPSMIPTLYSYVGGKIKVKIDNNCDKVVQIIGFGFPGTCEPAHITWSYSARQQQQQQQQQQQPPQIINHRRCVERMGHFPSQPLAFTTKHTDCKTQILLSDILPVNPRQPITISFSFRIQFKYECLATSTIFNSGQFSLGVRNIVGGVIPFNIIRYIPTEQKNNQIPCKSFEQNDDE